jgi:sec-independent protein translocase protein TatA
MVASGATGGESEGVGPTGSLPPMQGYEIFLVVGVIVLLFGGSQLPKLARSLGQAKREFESGADDAKTTNAKDTTITETKTTKSVTEDDQA